MKKTTFHIHHENEKEVAKSINFFFHFSSTNSVNNGDYNPLLPVA